MSTSEGAKNYFFQRYCSHVHLSPEEKATTPEWQKELRARADSPQTDTSLSSYYSASPSPEAESKRESDVIAFGLLAVLSAEQKWKTRYCEVKKSLLVVYRKKTVVAAVDLKLSGEAKLLPPSAAAIAGVFANSKWSRWKQSEGFIFSMRAEEGRYFKAKLPDREQAMWWVRNINAVREELRNEMKSLSQEGGEVQSLLSFMSPPPQLPQQDVEQEQEEELPQVPSQWPTQEYELEQLEQCEHRVKCDGQEQGHAAEAAVSNDVEQRQMQLEQQLVDATDAHKPRKAPLDERSHEPDVDARHTIDDAEECHLTDEEEQDKVDEHARADGQTNGKLYHEDRVDAASSFFAFSPDADESNASSCFSHLEHQEKASALYGSYPHFHSAAWTPGGVPQGQDLSADGNESLSLETDDDSDDAGSVEIYRLKDIVNGNVHASPSSSHSRSRSSDGGGNDENDCANRCIMQRQKRVLFAEEEQREAHAMEVFLSVATASHGNSDTSTKLSPIKPTQRPVQSLPHSNVRAQVQPTLDAPLQRCSVVDGEDRSEDNENYDPNKVSTTKLPTQVKSTESDLITAAKERKKSSCAQMLEAAAGATVATVDLYDTLTILECSTSATDVDIDAILATDGGVEEVSTLKPLHTSTSSGGSGGKSEDRSELHTIESEEVSYLDRSSVEASMINAKDAFTAAASAAIDAADAAQLVTKAAIKSPGAEPVRFSAIEAASAAIAAADSAIAAVTAALEVSSHWDSFRLSLSDSDESIARTTTASLAAAPSQSPKADAAPLMELLNSLTAPEGFFKYKRSKLLHLLQVLVIAVLFTGFMHFLVVLMSPAVDTPAGLRPHFGTARVDFINTQRTRGGDFDYSSPDDWQQWRSALMGGGANGAAVDKAMLDKIQRITTLSPDTPDDIKIAIMHYTRKGTIQPTVFRPTAFPAPAAEPNRSKSSPPSKKSCNEIGGVWGRWSCRAAQWLDRSRVESTPTPEPRQDPPPADSKRRRSMDLASYGRTIHAACLRLLRGVTNAAASIGLALREAMVAHARGSIDWY